MFVALQSERSRSARRAFAALCLLPSLALVLWGAWWRSPLHRDAYRRELEAMLGAGVRIGGLEHLGPGRVRLERMAVRDADGASALEVPSLDVDLGPGEVRLAAPAAAIGGRGMEALGRLARAWLSDPHRFRRDVVADVRSLDSGGGAGGGVRIECVATDAGRAVRVRTAPESSDGLVVRVLEDASGGAPRLEVSAASSRPVPVELLSVLLEWPGLSAALGPRAVVTGAMTLTRAGSDSAATFSGTIDGADLTTATAATAFGVRGGFSLRVERGEVIDGRLVSLDGRLTGGPGDVASATLESLVAALGARAGAGWDRSTERIAFDSLSARVAIAGGEFSVEADRGPLVAAGGRPILEAPIRGVPVERLAWALAPPAAEVVPAVPSTAWLLRVLPLRSSPGPAGAGPSASRPLRR